MGKRQPAAPDPGALAAQQGAVNTQAAAQNARLSADAARLQAALNRGNTVTPAGRVINRPVAFGGPSFEEWAAPQREAFAGSDAFLGNVHAHERARAMDNWNAEAERRYAAQFPQRDQWETVVELSPNQRRIFEQGEQLDIGTGQMALDALPRVREIMAAPLALARDDADARERATAGIMSRLEPQFARDREAAEARLVAQGFGRGSQGFERALDEQNRMVTDARMQALTAGLAESRAAAGFNNQVSLTERQQPLAELGMLFGLGPGFQMPQAADLAPVGVGAPQVGAPDVMGAAMANYQTRSNAAAQQNAAMWNALGQIGGQATRLAAGGWGDGFSAGKFARTAGGLMPFQGGMK